MIREQLSYWLPPRFLRFQSFRYLYTFALVADATIEAALQGMAARFPGFGTPTALSRIASDRGIRRGFAETDDSFVSRLVGFLLAHKKQGSAFEVMRQVQGYLGPLKPRCRIVWSNGTIAVWRTLNSDGTTEQVVKTPSNFNWDNRDAELFSRAWLIIYSTAPNDVWAQDGIWDDTATRTWDEDEAVGTWGSTATLEQIQGVRDIVTGWKAAHSLYPEIIVSFDDSLFDPNGTSPPNPDGNWRYYSKNVAGEQVMARAQNAVYWQGAA